MLCYLFSFFSLGDVARASLVCKSWHSISLDNALWKSLLKRLGWQIPQSVFIELLLICLESNESYNNDNNIKQDTMREEFKTKIQKFNMWKGSEDMYFKSIKLKKDAAQSVVYDFHYDEEKFIAAGYSSSSSSSHVFSSSSFFLFFSFAFFAYFPYRFFYFLFPVFLLFSLRAFFAVVVLSFLLSFYAFF